MLTDWLAANGAQLASPDQADLVAISCIDARFGAKVRRLQHQYPRTIVGGGGSNVPDAYDPPVVAGDYRQWFAVYADCGYDSACELDSVWDGSDDRVIPDWSFDWRAPYTVAEDGRVQLVLSRGCKRRCVFCQPGWQQPYEEHPEPARVISDAWQLQRARTPTTYITNDLQSISFCSQLPPTASASMTMAALRLGLPSSRLVRLGVEGISERLRRAIKKPISNDDLIDSTLWLLSEGKNVRWFMLCGLPGETADDWTEIKHAITEVARYSDRYHLAISFTSFLASPATPLADIEIDDSYWPHWEEFWDWYFCLGWCNRIAIYRPAGPENRHKLQQAYRTNVRLQYPYRKHISRALRHYWNALS